MDAKQKASQAERQVLGTTSMGVYYERPAAPVPAKKQNKRAKKRVDSGKTLRSTLVTGALLALFAALAVLGGEELWALVSAPAVSQPESVQSVAAVATASPVPAPSEAVQAPVVAPLTAAKKTPEAATADGLVWVPQSGSRYHSHDACSGMKEAQAVSLDEALAGGFTPCKRCGPPE